MVRNKLSLALAAAGLLALTGTAQAGALATSTLEMTNFKILHSDGTAYDIGDFSPIIPASSANIAATYNGVNAGGVLSGGPTATGQIDLLPACIGPGCPGVVNNAFPALTNPPLGNFVAADQQEQNSPITGQVDPTIGAVPLGAIAKSGSWAVLEGAAAGPNTASSTNQLNSGFIFSVGQADSLTFAFDAAIYQESYLSNDAVFPANAQTTSQFFFKITDQESGVVVFDFTPDGDTTTGTGITGQVDPFSLNSGTSRTAPFPFTGTSLLPGGTAGTKMTGSFSATSAVLTPGRIYRLEATLKTTAAASFVPEPGVLGLLGLGLLGLGFTVRRKA